SQQLFGNPLVGNAPIGVGESLWNPQPLQPGLVNAGGLRGSTGWDHQFAGERPWQRSGSGDGASATWYLAFRSLYQRSTIARQAHLCVQEPHPGSVPVALAPSGFLVSEPGQAPQMTPVGAGQVASVNAGQLLGDGGGHCRFQADSTDVNPSLQMARA